MIKNAIKSEKGRTQKSEVVQKVQPTLKRGKGCKTTRQKENACPKSKTRNKMKSEAKYLRYQNREGKGAKSKM